MGFTQEQAALHLGGMSVYTLRAWECRNRLPEGFTLLALIKEIAPDINLEIKTHKEGVKAKH